MNIKTIMECLEGKEVALGSGGDYKYGFASDLMSDVLTLTQDNVVLLTGLATVQTIRTADMAGISLVVLVRNKKANEQMLEIASEFNITIIETPFSMFRASAILYNKGLVSCF